MTSKKLSPEARKSYVEAKAAAEAAGHPFQTDTPLTRAMRRGERIKIDEQSTLSPEALEALLKDTVDPHKPR